MPTRTTTQQKRTAQRTRSRVSLGLRAHGGDDGQAAALAVIALTTLAVVLVMAIAQLGTTVLERSAARTAADAVALAAVIGGRPAADLVARANGATVVEWTADPYEVTVTVRVGDTYATARATDAP